MMSRKTESLNRNQNRPESFTLTGREGRPAEDQQHSDGEEDFLLDGVLETLTGRKQANG